jgi:hypothetical protein
MPKEYDVTREEMVGTTVELEEGITLHFPVNVLEGFNSILRVRLGDLPPSVLAAIWHDTNLENPDLYETIAQVFFDNCGEDIADYYSTPGEGN